MKPLHGILLSLILCSSPLPALAQRTGPRGNKFSGTTQVTPRTNGGYHIQRDGSVVTPNDGRSAGRWNVETDGNRNLVFDGSGTAVGRRGYEADWTTSGSGSFSPESGYRGQSTTLINGLTYTAETSDGQTTIVRPSGNTTTYTRPHRSDRF
ncbi:MAG: hypothetical protein AAFY15_08565 [Cyanobacteria bacterium J06648_11]